MENTGMKVVDKRNAAIMAKPTARAKGTNRPRAAPSIRNEGKNTARMHNMARRMGTIVSDVPFFTAWAIDLLLAMCV